MGRRPTHHVETLVIGGGQAGLATGYHLKRRRRPFLIIDAHPRVGDAWRTRWDSLRLFTTARYSSLPGMPFPGPPWHYPTKDETADYLEAYAARFGLPIKNDVSVGGLRRRGPIFEASAGVETYTADNVVLATGMYRTPRIPDFAALLDRGILQVHSRDYRNPSQLRPGAVLVVGAANSGAEIALELSDSHHTWLSGRDPGQEPTRSGTLPDKVIMPLVWFAASRVLTVGNPLGRKARDHFLHPPRGIPLARVRREDLADAGIERVPRVTGVHGGQPVLADSRTLEVRNVVWCTGFDMDLSWVDLPLTVRDGYPDNDRGVVSDQPGLYVMGLAFQRSLSSALIGGVGRDADDISAHITNRMSHRASSTI